jgi:DNA-binding MarR family transcriptional regulator
MAWRGLLVFLNRGLPEIERTLKGRDLLFVHYTILVALSEAPDRQLRLTDLADMANLSPSRLTHRLHTLIDHGYVALAPDEQDGRSKQASLTESGFAKLESVAPHHVADVRRLLFDHLDQAQTQALADGLSHVAGNLCDHACFNAESPEPTSST